MIYGNRVEGIIWSLALAIKARSPQTMAHSSRVASLARWLGAACGLETRQVEDLYLGGLIHDIGKMGLPDSVLLESGALDGPGWELMRRHPALGESIIAPLHSLRSLAPLVRSHHERYDGRGYPDRLAGEEIPLLARITAVCDAYDAMTSERPYRPALGRREADLELRRGAGTQWDPAVLVQFLSAEASIAPEALSARSAPVR
jgi:HD-GYP domain-containing protein (c-di-GMP phosphodiesterase class II)